MGIKKIPCILKSSLQQPNDKFPTTIGNIQHVYLSSLFLDLPYPSKRRNRSSYSQESLLWPQTLVLFPLGTITPHVFEFQWFIS